MHYTLYHINIYGYNLYIVFMCSWVISDSAVSPEENENNNESYISDCRCSYKIYLFSYNQCSTQLHRP